MHKHFHKRPQKTSRSAPSARASARASHAGYVKRGALLGVLCFTALASGVVYPLLTPKNAVESALTPDVSTVLALNSTPQISTPSVAAAVASTAEPAVLNPVEVAPEPLSAPIATVFPASVNLRINSGDTLLTILTDTGVSYEEANLAVQAIRKIYDPKTLNVGQQVAVDLDPRDDDPHLPELSSLSLPVSKTAKLELKRTHTGDFNVKKIEAETVKKLVKVGGPIKSSFYQTATAIGLSPETIGALIKVYSYDIDFQRDIKRGDKLELLVERTETEDGVVVSTGGVVYASLDLGNRKIGVYRFKDKNGNVDYYNEKGESLRKALLRTPINGARITSGFGMRTHPLLGYSKMHRGVDFGALAGTPIYAAGDGVVEMAGANGSYGNYVRIKHDAKYSTAYAHASRIAAGVRQGARVKQGQVIAYVGSTGRSTGPHLHYEILANGEQINPAGVKFKTGNSLSGKELAAFKTQVGNVRAALGIKPEKKQVASNEPAPKKSAKKTAKN